MVSRYSRRGGRGASCLVMVMVSALVLAMSAGSALAQNTGGSFGGGSFAPRSGDSDDNGGGRDRDSWSPSGNAPTRAPSEPAPSLSGHREPDDGWSRPTPSPPREVHDPWRQPDPHPTPSDHGPDSPSTPEMGIVGKVVTGLFAGFFFLFGAGVVLGVIGLFGHFFFGSFFRDIASHFRSRPRSRSPQPPAGQIAESLIDVAGVELAIDWRARRQVQARLEELAKDGDTSTPEGLASLAHATARTLKEAEVSWLYAAAVSTRPLPAREGERLFRDASAHARSKFRHEVIRSADGTTRTVEAPEQHATREEGEGVVVVTLLVAAHRSLSDVSDVTDARQLRHVLEQVMALDAKTLAVLEVIWSPAEENDRMSTAEMEVLYPELRQLDERDVVGRVFCGRCAAPYAKELLACPNCGAPVEDARSQVPAVKLPPQETSLAWLIGDAPRPVTPPPAPAPRGRGRRSPRAGKGGRGGRM